MKYLIWSKFIQKNLIEKSVFLFSFCLLLGFSSTLDAQIKPLDNWDLEVVNKKDLQSESYFSFEKQGEFKSHMFNSFLRYGIMKNVELQVNWRGLKEETILGDLSRQTASVGLKAFLFDESKYLPGISLIGTINLTPDPSNTPIMPSLNILFRKSLIENFALTGNFKFSLDEQEGNLGRNFAVNLDAELTQWWTAYLGVKSSKTYSHVGDRAFFSEHVELGMLFWAADGLRIYPYYDFGLDDESFNSFNIGVLLHL